MLVFIHICVGSSSSALHGYALYIRHRQGSGRPNDCNIRTRPDDAPHLFKRPQIGIIAGFNFTSNNGSTSTATPPFLYNPEVGPMAGFTFTFPIGSFLGIRLEALYSQDAFTDETLIGLSTYIYYNRLSYIDVPIMLQIKPFRKLTFFGGADYQYLVRNVYQYVDSPVSPSVQQECQNHTPKNYFPGVSYQVYRITVGARVTMNVPNNYALDQQNAVLFQLSLGYTFFSRYR